MAARGPRQATMKRDAELVAHYKRMRGKTYAAKVAHLATQYSLAPAYVKRLLHKHGIEMGPGRYERTAEHRAILTASIRASNGKRSQGVKRYHARAKEAIKKMEAGDE